MKRKLSIAFALIILSLAGIVIFQGYWTVNAYKIKKKQFDTDINDAMLRAMDSCKRDYFDSIRVVIIKRLSSQGFVIKIDTLTGNNDSNTYYNIWLAADSLQGGFLSKNTPYRIRKPNLEYYKRKIDFKGKQSIPALLTEIAFYEPGLLFQLNFAFEIGDMDKVMSEWHQPWYLSQPGYAAHKTDIVWFLNKEKEKQMPPNYRQADSVKMYGYLKKELEKINIYAPFTLAFTPQKQPNAQNRCSIQRNGRVCLQISRLCFFKAKPHR